MGIITDGNTFQVKNGDEDVIKMEFDDFLYKESPVIAVQTKSRELTSLELTMKTHEAVLAVLSHPTVGDKSFLVTIGDQTVG